MRKTIIALAAIALVAGTTTVATAASRTTTDVQDLATAESHVVDLLHHFKDGASWQAQFNAALSVQSADITRVNADLKPVKPRRNPGVGSTIVVTGPVAGTYSVTLVAVITDLQWSSSAPIAGTLPFAVKFRVVDTSSNKTSDDADIDTSLVGSNGQIYSPIAGEGIEGCTDFNNGNFGLEPGASAVGCVLFGVPSHVRVAKVQWSPDAGQGSIASWSLP